ncbi:iron complex transport system substrate-binding protein [Amorphus suaedae]
MTERPRTSAKTISRRGAMPAAVAGLAALAMLAGQAPARAGEVTTLPACAAPGDGALDTGRIVAIGGAITEILYDLGLDGKIVAVDTTSTFPPAALAEKPNVGYMRALSAEGVLSMSPSLLLVSEAAGPQDAIDVLKRASVPFVTVSDEASAAAVSDRIRFLGQVVCREAEAGRLAASVDAGFDDLARLREQIRTPKRVLFVMSMQSGRPLVAGADTAADAIIALAGAENAAGGIEGYKPISDEAVLEAAPDALLMMESTAAHSADILSEPAFRLTPAAEAGNVIRMEGQFLLGFGPRTPVAAMELARTLYPDLAGDAAGPRP